MKENNIMQNSMAGVGGPPQFNVSSDLDLANHSFPATEDAGIPEHLANQSLKISWVYFVQAGEGGPIKIGKAMNPSQRIGNLQVGNPHEVKLLHCLPDTGCTEGRIQGIFEESHLRGEWYNPTPDLLEFIDALKSKTEGRARQFISRTIRDRQLMRAKKAKAKSRMWKQTRQALRNGDFIQ